MKLVFAVLVMSFLINIEFNIYLSRFKMSVYLSKSSCAYIQTLENTEVAVTQTSRRSEGGSGLQDSLQDSLCVLGLPETLHSPSKSSYHVMQARIFSWDGNRFWSLKGAPSFQIKSTILNDLTGTEVRTLDLTRESEALGSSFGSAIDQLCDLGPVPFPLWTLVSPTIKWIIWSNDLQGTLLLWNSITLSLVDLTLLLNPLAPSSLQRWGGCWADLLLPLYQILPEAPCSQCTKFLLLLPEAIQGFSPGSCRSGWGDLGGNSWPVTRAWFPNPTGSGLAASVALAPGSVSAARDPSLQLWGGRETGLKEKK